MNPASRIQINLLLTINGKTLLRIRIGICLFHSENRRWNFLADDSGCLNEVPTTGFYNDFPLNRCRRSIPSVSQSSLHRAVHLKITMP